MATKYATARTVDRDELVAFLRPRHRGLLATTRARRTAAVVAGLVRRRPRGTHRDRHLSAASQERQRQGG